MQRGIAFLLVLLVSGPAVAGTRSSGRAERGAAVLVDEAAGAAIRARGVDWKAGFGADGASFTPFLGSDAPRNFPVAFQAPSVTAGARAIELDAHALPAREGTTVRYERGAVDELYRLSAGSIEQLFVVERPLGAGDVTVVIPVASDLEPTVDGARLRFANERGGVDYGGATAIDAAGQTLALSRTYVDGSIRIVVPDEFARSASYPLVVDPVVAAFGVFANTAQTELSPDITYDSGTQRYLCVAEVAFSATDHDVVSVLLERDGSLVAGSEIAVDATDEYWATPRCSALGLVPGFVVVAAIGIPGQSSRSIRARVGDGMSLLPALILSDADDGDNHSPDVGGGDTTLNARWMAAWTSTRNGDDEINARVIRVESTLPGAIVRVSADPAFRDAHPSVGNAGGAEFEIVFQREITPVDRDVWYAIVQNGGSITVPATALVVGATDDTRPSVSDLTNSFTLRAMLAFQRDAGGNSNVVVAEHSFFGGLQSLVDVSALDPATAGLEQFSPAIESDGERFVLAWCERDANGTRVLATEYHAVDQVPVPGVSRAEISAGSIDAQEVRLAGRIEPTGFNLGVGCVWTDDDQGGGRDVFAARYEPAVGLPTTPYCFGDGSGTACPCGNSGAAGHGCANSVNPSGALISSSGDATTLADTFVLQGSGMPPNTACLYFQGTNVGGNTFGDGLRCASGTTVRLGTKQNSAAGSSQYPGPGDASVSVRGAITIGGGARYYQAWYRNAAAFCTAATFNLSNGLRADWALL